jgi:hyperpolarization activated cyclic nucleotide-gated potassium channel 1
VQTVVTVGYGDFPAGSTLEKSIAIFMMFVGVIFYSITIGSLSSLLSSLDSKNAKLAGKLNTLNQMQRKYAIDNALYNRIKNALNYGLEKNDDDKTIFLNELPIALKIEVFSFE